MPRYEIRNTSNNALTYVEGEPTLDLMRSQAAGTYRARVMSAEEATDIVVPTLTGSITQASLTVGATATLTTNAPAGSTYQWRLNATPIGGATASSYATAAAGSLDCVITIPGNPQGPLTTAAVTVSVASVNPSITSFSITERAGGQRDLLNLVVNKNGSADTHVLGIVTRNGGTQLTGAQIKAGTGTFLERVVLDPLPAGTEIDLSGFTAASNGDRNIDVAVWEKNNGGVSDSATDNIIGANFTAPTATWATSTDGTQVIGTVSKNIYGTEAAGNWTVPGHTVSTVTISGATITLGITPSIANGDVDTVSYSGGDLVGEDGNALAAIVGASVTNAVPAPSSYTQNFVDSNGTAQTGRRIDNPPSFPSANKATFSMWTIGDTWNNSAFMNTDGAIQLSQKWNGNLSVQIKDTTNTIVYRGVFASAMPSAVDPTHYQINVDLTVPSAGVYRNGVEITPVEDIISVVAGSGSLKMESLWLFPVSGRDVQLSDVGIWWGEVIPNATLWNGGTPPDPGTLAGGMNPGFGSPQVFLGGDMVAADWNAQNVHLGSTTSWPKGGAFTDV